MTKVILRREGNTLVPADEDSLAAVLSFKEGAELIGDLHGARNIKHLRKFWVLASIVGDAMDVPREVVKKDVAIALGFTTTWLDHAGRVHVDAASIAVEKMTQEVFNQFFEKAVNVMAGWIGSDHKDLMRRFNEAAADNRYEGYRR
jgi:hypothetical protein